MSCIFMRCEHGLPFVVFEPFIVYVIIKGCQMHDMLIKQMNQMFEIERQKKKFKDITLFGRQVHH